MNKYNNKKTKGYDSKGESKRAFELKMLERSGEITDLKEQVIFELIPSQRELKHKGKVIERACTYIADFTYYDRGEYIVEDFKGFKTDIYKIKRKLMLFIHGIRIKETK